MSIAESYALACREPSDIVNHLPRMVDLVRRLDARHVIELGSRSGVSTIAWLYGLDQTGGRLTSVDLDPAPQIATWADWEHIQGNDLDPDLLARLQPAEIVFIDTSHTYDQTRAELATYRWMVKPGGVICGHDSELARPMDSPPTDPAYPVKRAVREFAADNAFDVQWFADCWGFYIISIE